MIGAEVDFYVEGLEEDPSEVIQLIQDYYKRHYPEESQFQRFQSDKLNVRTSPWQNKEIFIKLYEADEGRNCDNAHGFPYIGIQVRFDRETGQKVLFDKGQAENFLRP